MEQGNGLEYLVIPTGWEEPRIARALEELKKREFDKVVITGSVDGEPKDKWTHRQRVYKVVRKYGKVSREQVRIVGGIDSEEDILYFGEFLKEGDTVHFDTFYLHYLEYKTLINKAKRDGRFPKGVNLKIAPIPQGRRELFYGVIGLAEEIVKRRKLDYKQNRNEEWLDKLKGFVKRRLIN